LKIFGGDRTEFLSLVEVGTGHLWLWRGRTLWLVCSVLTWINSVTWSCTPTQPIRY